MEPNPGQSAEQALDDAVAPEPAVPAGLTIAASWTWRLLLIGLGIVVVGYLLQYFSGLTVPLAVAVLLAALLTPPKAWLVRHGMNKALASALTLVVGLSLVAGVVTGIVAQVVSQGPTLVTSAQSGLIQLVAWLSEGPLKLAPEQVQGALNDLFAQLPGKLQQWSGQIVGVAAGLAGERQGELGRELAGHLPLDGVERALRLGHLTAGQGHQP